MLGGSIGLRIRFEEAAMDSRQRTGHPTRTQVGGPLAAYAGGFRQDLAAKGYHPQVIGRHIGLMAGLSAWLDDRGSSSDGLTAGVAAEDLPARPAPPPRQPATPP